MYVVFARKYRPLRFGEVVGQEHVTRALRNAVAAGRVAHAYLFCGSRGVGKTTVARILAKALNCTQGPTPEPCCACDACVRIASGDDIDVMEIDGASNRGIDNVRQLRQNVGLAPARSRFKVYYIDEVHMLTGEAFNGLLKTLEEPPGHVKFIFSTTDAQKLPETVRSRCQRFDFRRISDGEVVKALERVCEAEGVGVEGAGLSAIARSARGSLRDALGALDQLAAFGDRIALSDVLGVLGVIDQGTLAEFVDAAAAQDAGAALGLLDAALSRGACVEDLAEQLAGYVRDLLVALHCGADAPLLAGSTAGTEVLARQSELFTSEQFTYMVQLLREAGLRARRETTGRIALELALLRMCDLTGLVSVQEALGSLGRGTDSEAGRAAEAEERPGGRLRRMQEKLEGPRRPTDAGASRPSGPEGMAEAKVRQFMACAGDPEAAQAVLADGPLMAAFMEADGQLDLRPERIERRAEGVGENDSGAQDDHLAEGE
jgi:DNA polymerase-3 subunit gamma/tau